MMVGRKLVSGVLISAALLAVCWVSLTSRVAGQVPTPTQEELQIFQGLSPDQQDSIMRALSGGGAGGILGGGLGGTGAGALGQRSTSQSDRRSQMYGQRGQERKLTEEEQEEIEPVIPELKALDWVIIEIDYTLPPRAIPPYLLSIYSAQSVSPSAASVLSGQLPTQAGANATNQQAGQAAALAAAAGAGGQPPSGQNPSANAGTSGETTLMQGQLKEEDRARLDSLMTLIRSKNPYQLSRDGTLTLPGFPPMALLGLTEEQATLRLKAEPTFRNVDIRLTRLPIRKTGVERLKPFGYDLFDNPPSTFAPVTNVPVPSDYVVGPGDELDVQLYGTQNRNLKLIVARDGTVNFPEIGPLHVAGMRFEEAKADIESHVQHQMVGVRANVTMGDTRSIRVFVLGEAKYPGSYTVSGFGTITSALFAAGGVRKVGSLRNIQLKRRGALVRRLDLYDLLIRGDTTDDTRLQQGDVVFVPAVGTTVSVDGEVRRPAIYEIRGESTVADVLELAGGLTPEADPTRAALTRIEADERRVVVSVELPGGAKTERVRNGDVLRVMRLRPTLDSGVLVQGYVFTPGTFAWRQGLRLSDVIHSVDDLRPDADIHYLLIRREAPVTRHISVLSADLAAALNAPGSAADVELMPRDRITVFDLSTGRDHVIQPVLDELRLQGTSGEPSEVVHVDGQVRVPGEYPLQPGMKISDLVRAGGGTIDSAYGRAAELTRFTVIDGESRQTELVKVDLAAAMHGDPASDLVLAPFDTLSVREVPFWGQEENVVLKGEVRFPGTYSIRRGETLKSVIERAGGLTKYAFPEGSVFTRESLRKREQEQVDLLADRMQRDLTILAVQYSAAGQGNGVAALSVGQSLLSQLRTAKAVGRLVIDLPRLMRSPPGSAADVVLRDGDQLIVPRYQQQVTVIGEVQSPTSHLYDPHLSREDYISMSGGMTRRADSGRIYVVRANGSVFAQEGSRWFAHSTVPIKPGDTIVVPLNAEKIPPLPFWQAVTQILYNVAIAVAAVHAL
jgi:protein involved in polysaccharide export with SLBB domain